ncbi:nucleotide sugar dehydrogenase [Patescibacteria group bacterium]|nr:MAG: nucleotide sugar dehydrogenase [Patescibacteria group bacterium]
MRHRLTPILVSPDVPIRAVLEIMNAAPKVTPEAAPSGIVLVVDGEQRLVGIVTDGDVRRAVLRSHDLSLPVETIVNRNPITVPAGLASVDVLRRVGDQLAARGAKTRRIDRIVLVDDDRRPVDVVSSFELWKESEVGARTVCIVGLGFVGLTLAVTMAEVGYDVVGIERRPDVLAHLRKGTPHFHEKNLPALLKKHVGSRLTLEHAIAPGRADIYIVSVGTPIDEATHVVDYGHLTAAAEAIGDVLRVGDLVILRSTVPVGTTRSRVIPILEQRSGLAAGRDFSVAFAPERTVEGRALEELRTLPQVIGGWDARSLDLAARVFRAVAPTIVATSGLEAAEMVKLVNNSYRDYVFAFANQVALLCDRLGISSTAVIDAANEGYPRNPIARPSPGVGGICLRKDPILFAESARNAGVDPRITLAARDLNRAVPERVAEKVLAFAADKGIAPEKLRVGVLGVAFKGMPETSDVRGSVTLDVATALRARGVRADIVAHDPVVPQEEITAAGFRPAAVEDVFAGSDAVLQLTNHPRYETLDFGALAASGGASYFFDGWNMHHPDAVRSRGMRYDALGTDRG